MGCVADHKQEVYSAFSELNVGRGKVIITSLDIKSFLEENNKNSVRDEDYFGSKKPDIAGQQILLNILRRHHER